MSIPLPTPERSRPALPAELTFVEGLRDAFLLLDAEFRVTYVNARGRESMRSNGQDAALALGRGVWELFPVAEGAYVDREFKRAWDADGLVAFDYYHPDTKAYYEIDVMRHGDTLGVYWRDISARRLEDLERAASEAELYATSRRLEELVDGAPLAILVVDNGARVLRWNPAAEEMFQWKADEVLGRVLPTIPPDEQPHLESMRERVGESIRAIPARRLRKDGVALDVQVSTAPLRDASGTVTGVIGMIADVTEQRKLEAQLRMAQKMEAVGLLAGGVAHDFNNLLTAIKGFTSLLQMTIVADDHSTEFLGEISKAADRAASLTAQLLAFSRRQLLRPEPLDLNARVRGIERMLRLLVRNGGELRLDLDPALAQVLADPGQIEQVIMNLAVNARDAIHARSGGQVVIATSNVVLRDEFVQWGVEAAPGEYVRLDVRDNGVGIDQATQARIFDPFFTTKEAGHGTGLGLATVFGIVKQSGGYVWVSSAPGEGATFSVYLPAARTGSRATPIGVPVISRGNELVLLVEDEASVRRVARRALELHGFRVLEACDGTEARALAEMHEIDLLLTDVMMPGMPGPALVASLRERHPRLPALFMSGHTDDVVRSGLVDPATPFLAKPFTPSQLAEKVREALDHAHR